jgi:ABC-type phosphate transport system substrate-binding protein
MRIRLSWIGALGVLIAAPRLAAAADCPDFTAMNPIYLNGSSAAEPLVVAMAKVLAAQTSPTTLVYAKPGSCVGVTSVNEDATPTGACAVGACFTGTVEYWDPNAPATGGGTGAVVTCTLTAPTHVDVGLSDVWVDTCTGAQPKAGVKDTTGPVEPMLFVVPEASQQKAITAEEAYFVFGFGASGQAKPWTVEANLAIRNPTSGTEQVIAHNIGVPAGRWKGMDKGGSGGVLTAVMNAPAAAAESTIGILGSDVYDANRTVLNSLAFQGFHQFGAFYADSTSTSFDKRNVRNGHYVNWGYLHMVTHLDATSTMTPTAKKFIDWVTGNTGATGTPSPFGDITDIIIQAKMVPTCAMKVSRQSEGGALSTFTPAADCSAKFEAAVAPH